MVVTRGPRGQEGVGLSLLYFVIPSSFQLKKLESEHNIPLYI
jgi:hypothetical protein